MKYITLYFTEDEKTLANVLARIFKESEVLICRELSHNAESLQKCAYGMMNEQGDIFNNTF